MSEKLLTIDEFKKSYGIPDSHKFLGFIVQRLDTDEFLAFYEDDSYSERFGWSLIPSPQLVIVYSHFEEPVKWVDNHHDKSSIVSALFDTEYQHAVFPYYVPKHLERMARKVFK